MIADFLHHSLLPITSRIRARFASIQSMQEAAMERVEIAPPSTSLTLPAIALPDEFSRIKSVIPTSTLDNERQYITAGRLEHRSTIAYRLRDAVLADHTLYWAGGHLVAKARRKRALLLGPCEDYYEAQLCTHAPSHIYFGHWLRDAMAMELLAELRGLPPLSYLGTPWKHEPGYRQIMNLPGQPISLARVERLWVVDDIGLNENWVSRFRELRKRVRQSSQLGGRSRVFLTRGSTGTHRQLLNEAEIANTLALHGFDIVSPEQLTAQQIVNSLASAKVVVSVEGSALNHAQFSLPTNSAVLVIQPPYRFNAFHKVLFDFSQIRFSYVVAEPDNDGFRLPPDRLLKTLDLVETAICEISV